MRNQYHKLSGRLLQIDLKFGQVSPFLSGLGALVGEPHAKNSKNTHLPGLWKADVWISSVSRQD